MIRPPAADELAPLATALSAQPLLARYRISAEGLARDLAKALGRGEGLLVVEQDGRLLGLAWFLRTGTFAAGGYLRLIALVPGSERHGLGAALLEQVEQEVRGAGSRTLFLLVSHWNQVAQRFYTLRGYLEAGRLPAFVLPDTDELIYFKRI